MNIKTKKLLAKEFLIFITTVIFYIISMHTWKYISNKNYDREKTIVQLAEKYSQYLNQELLDLCYYKFKDDYSSKEFKIKLLSEEYFRKEIYNRIATEASYNSFIKDLSGDFNFKNININYNEYINLNNSFFNLKKSLDVSEGLLLILFLIFYILRYTIYGIIWSIRTLKK